MGSPKSKFVNHAGGQALVFYDESNEARWLDAIGPNVRKWEMRYGSDFTTAKEYTLTVIGTTPTVAQGATAGVRAIITTTATQYDSAQIQVVGTPFQFAAGYPCYFGASLAFDSATLSDFYVGLVSTDTTILTAAANTLDIAASGAGFYALGTGTVYAHNEIHANEVATASAIALDTNAHIYEFLYDGASGIDFFMDGTLVSRATTYIPTVVLTPSIALKASTGAARIGYVNWMRAIQLA
jgi:hypothetical protein